MYLAYSLKHARELGFECEVSQGVEFLSLYMNLLIASFISSMLYR